MLLIVTSFISLYLPYYELIENNAINFIHSSFKFIKV